MAEEKKNPKKSGEYLQDKAKPSKNGALVKSEETQPGKEKEEKPQQDRLIDKPISEMPPEVLQSLRSFSTLISGTTTSSGPLTHPLFDKFTDAHIDKYLDYIQRDDDHEYDLKRTNRWFYLGYALLAMCVFIAGVVYLLPRDKDLLIQLIQIIVLIAGGIGAGYGIKSHRRDE